MTRGHRRVHVVVWCIVGPLALVLLAAAVRGRPAASPAFDDVAPPPPEGSGGP